MILIDLGCGEKKINNAIGVDIRPCSDIMADCKYLPFREKVVDSVFSSHLIEHFSHREIKTVLVEWYRIMRKNAILEIRCPDLWARSLLFFLQPTLENVKNIYGEQDYIGNYHKSGYSYNILKKLLISVGMIKIKRIYDGYMGIPFLPNCLHVICKKGN